MFGTLTPPFGVPNSVWLAPESEPLLSTTGASSTCTPLVFLKVSDT